jgi:preprotein translocase subunit SecG
MAQTLARRTAKRVFFLLIILVVGKSLGGAETYISQDFARKVAVFISGKSNIETLYDAYFYIDFVIVVFLTTAVYLITMTLIQKIRSK